jgi:hypothetical protein
MKNEDLLPEYTELTIFMKKSNPNQLDMRFKSNREWVKQTTPSKFWQFMQKIAEKTGSPKIFGVGHLKWELWFSPIYHYQQWQFRRKPIQIYGSGEGEKTGEK